MNIGDIFNLLLLQPTLNLIVVILGGIEALNLPGALGLSIILLTVIIKLVTWPLSNQQLRASKKMMDLRPHMDELKVKHKDNKQALASAQMALYKEHGVNPIGGCLPALIQILLIYPLYQVIEAFLNPAHGLEKINYFLYSKDWYLETLPDPNFLGLNLAIKPWDVIGMLGSGPNIALGLIVILLIPIFTAALQFVLSKMMAPQGVKIRKDDKPQEVKEKKQEEDMATAMQGQMLVMMPIMIGFFAFQFPIGLSLYWNTLSIMSIYQQYLITGWGGLGDWVKKIYPDKSIVVRNNKR